MLTLFSRLLAGLVICAGLGGCAHPGPRLFDATAARALDGVNARSVTIISEGTRLAGTVYTPATSRGKLPTVVMASGWGGVASQLEPDALELARAGYLVLTFDYRGWGASDARVLLTQPAFSIKPTPTSRRYTAEVVEVREVIEPEDMVTDWLNVMHWLQGESQSDTSRVGLWGTGLSGGMVATVAVRDGRVKAIFCRSPIFPSSALPRPADGLVDATRRARGDMGYPFAGERAVGALPGAPITHRFVPFSPIDDVRALGPVAMAIVIADLDDVRQFGLFDNREHGLLAYERHTGPKRLDRIATNHAGIAILGARKQANELAQAWFQQHLKVP